jgi:hypothetical protein
MEEIGKKFSNQFTKEEINQIVKVKRIKKPTKNEINIINLENKNSLEIIEPIYMIDYENLKSFDEKEKTPQTSNILVIPFKELNIKLKKNHDYFHVKENEECLNCINENKEHTEILTYQINYYKARYDLLLDEKTDAILEYNYHSNSEFGEYNLPLLSLSITTLSERKEFIFISKHVDEKIPGGKSQYLFNSPSNIKNKIGTLFSTCFDFLLQTHFEGITHVAVWNISGDFRSEESVNSEVLFFLYLSHKYKTPFNLSYMPEGHYPKKDEYENGYEFLVENYPDFKTIRYEMMFFSLDLIGCSLINVDDDNKREYKYHDKKMNPVLYGSERCEVCSLTENLKKCSKCKSVFYCGLECQKLDWKNHKLICN